MERRVAFLGTHNWRAHEAVRWWSAAYGQADKAVAKAAAAAGDAPPLQLDVFGVGRESLENRRSMVWQGLRPGDDVRVASRRDVAAIVCSGHGPNDVQIVKDCRRAGKAVFVESLERFQPGDIAELAEGSPAGTGGGPALMTGLYLRFDSVLQEAAQLGIESVVGRPLLYQAHASTVTPSLAGHGRTGPTEHQSYEGVTPSLYELGMEQVDVLRFLLNTEASEVFAAGSLAPGQRGGAAQEGMDAYEAISLTIKTSGGAVAVISLDSRGGSSPRQHILVVGDTNRASFTGQVAAADLQAAGINHFLDVAAEGAPARLAAADCLAAAAVMAAAQQSLRTGAPAAVCYDWTAAAAAATAAEVEKESGSSAGTAATVRLAASSAGAKLGSAASSLMEGARQLIQGASSYGEQKWEQKHMGGGVAGGDSGACTPVGRREEEEEEEVSTPPHHHQQGTPPPKNIGTPESPALVSAFPN